jgi:hypothetical protein
MNWPWRRFERMFLAHLARREIEKLERTADMMRAAIHANPNYDGDEKVQNAKQKRLEQIDESVNHARIALREQALGRAVEEEISPVEDKNTDDPFYAAMHRNLEMAQANVVKPQMEHAGAGVALMEQ